MIRLQQFSALAAAFLAGASAGKAQIQYHDLDPDKVSNDHTNVFLDVDANGTMDLKFTVNDSATTGWNTSGATIRQLNSSWSFLGSGLVNALNYGNVISSAGGWSLIPTGNHFYGNLADASYSTEGPGTYGNASGAFLNKPDKFLGIRKFESGNYYCGWLRLSVRINFIYYPTSVQHDMVINLYDYAFNPTAGEPIRAGETGANCNAPFPRDAETLSPTIIKLKWFPVTDAAEYKLRYRLSGTTTWNNLLVPGTKNGKIIPGLDCNANYEWQVAALCDGGASESDFSDLKTFTTPACKLGDFSDQPELNVYPNPATDHLFIDLDGINAKDLQIDILDMLGNKIRSVESSEDDMLNIDIADLVNGMYILHISNNEMNRSVKFVKQ